MDLLIKVVTHTIENQMKEQNSGFLGMLLVSLGTSFLGNILADKGIMWIGEDLIKTWQDFQCHLILWLISKYKSIIRINLNPNTIEDGTYIVNLDDYKSIRTHWFALYVNGDSMIYFDRYSTERIPEEIKRYICRKNMKNIFRMQTEYVHNVWVLWHWMYWFYV